jgi:DNA-binding XRE family transcriptional regulator
VQEYEIEFYDKADGSEPVKEFILSLDKKMQAKVLRTVALLREEGPCLREPYSKALDDGIFEIRTKFGSDITRVLYFFVVGDPHKWIYQEDPENTCFRDHTGKTISRRLSCPKGEFQMTNFNDFLNEQMKDPEFKAEWDALDPEFSVIEAMLKARKESGLTQKQLSERTGIAQTDISKLERGNANPSLRTLQRLAAGMGMKVKIEFVPASAK